MTTLLFSGNSIRNLWVVIIAMLIAALSLLLARSSAPVAELDFELYNNLIHVPVTVKGHKATAVLDTGAGSAVMDLALADDWKLAETGDIPVGGIGKDQVHGRLLTDTTAEIGGIHTPIHVAIPLGSITKISGRHLEVVLGYEFLKDHIVEVDYPKRHMRIFDTEAGPSASGVAVPIHFVQNHVHVSTVLTIQGKDYEMETVIDTGAAVSGGLTTRFLKEHPISVVKTPKSVIGGGVGGMLEGSYFRPDTLRFANVSFSKPVMSLSDSTGGASGANSPYDLLVGGEILSRFRLTIDYPHKQLLLEPGIEILKPFEADKTGLRIYAEGPDLRTFRIVGVLPGSTSETAGLKVDDVIEAVDGRSASSLTLQTLRTTFRSATAKAWDVDVRRSGEGLRIHLPARSIV